MKTINIPEAYTQSVRTAITARRQALEDSINYLLRNNLATENKIKEMKAEIFELTQIENQLV